MNIEFLADDNPLYVLPFFEEFLRHYSKDFTIVRITLCPPMGRRSRIQLLKQLTGLYGYFGMLRILTRIGKARCLSIFPKQQNATRFHSLTQLAKAYGISCEMIANPNSETFRNQLSAGRTDLLISVACPFILKAPLLRTPPKGCINIHHAALPRYKGMMPTFWQLFHREKKVGLTIHYMSEAIDEGLALLQDNIDVWEGETLDHLIRRTKIHGAHCMARVLHQIEKNEHCTFVFDHKKGSYFTFPTLSQMIEFRRRGLRAI